MEWGMLFEFLSKFWLLWAGIALMIILGTCEVYFSKKNKKKSFKVSEPGTKSQNSKY